MSELFSVDDLFITVRDTSLRAYNRAAFMSANFGDKPRLMHSYVTYLCSLDSSALREINKVQNDIRKYGRITIQNILKYRINPYDQYEV